MKSTESKNQNQLLTKMIKKNNSLAEKIKSVEDFHNVFLIGNSDSPTLLNEREFNLRYNLIKEENEEYLDACKKGDIIEIADALGDQLYILFGTILKHGLQHKIEEVFDEIHRSNMSKLDADGQPIFREDGKILKSEFYFKPDLAKLLK